MERRCWMRTRGAGPSVLSFFFSSRRRHTRFDCDWSSDVCSSDLDGHVGPLTSAYIRARDADPKCSFGDMIAVSHPVDLELAEFLARVISDGIVAPGFEEGALEIL